MGVFSMILLEELQKIPSLSGPIALTIGTFDGVHLGHQHLLQQLKKHGTAVVLTFSNHPAEILRPQTVPQPIDTLQQRLNRLEKNSIDLTLLLPFTPELACQPYDIFLKEIHQYLPFTHLILGEGSAFGYKAQGTQTQIQSLAKEMQFEAIYLPKFIFEGEAVSSKKIRELIRTGNFEQAFCLLGRKF